MWWRNLDIVRAIKRIYIYRDCPHVPHLRYCLHGDNIKAHGGKRSICFDCGKTFKELPKVCTIETISKGYTVYHKEEAK